MAIVSTNLTYSRSASLDERQIRIYKIVGRVRTDSAGDGAGTILSAMTQRNIDIGSAFQEPNGYIDMGARCKSIHVDADQDDPKTWLVDCTFTSAPPERTASGERGYQPSTSGGGGGGSGQSREREPASRPPEVRWTFERNRKPMRRGHLIDPATGEILKSDMPLQTSAGFPFDPLPEIDDTRTVLVYTRNELEYLPTVALQYGDAINDDPFWGFPPGAAKMCVPEAERVYEGNLFFWRITYKVEFRHVEPYWDVDILDAGYHAWDLATGEVYLIKARDGENTSDPWPLDGEGVEADPMADDFEAVYRRYRPIEYRRIPFAPLRLV